MITSTLRAVDPHLDLKVRGDLPPATTGARCFIMNLKDITDGIYRAKPKDIVMVGLSVTNSGGRVTWVEDQMCDPHMMAVALPRPPPCHPLGLTIPLSILDLAVVGLMGASVCIKPPVGVPRGSGGAPRPARGRPAAAAAAWTRAARTCAAARMGRRTAWTPPLPPPLAEVMPHVTDMLLVKGALVEKLGNRQTHRRRPLGRNSSQGCAPSTGSFSGRTPTIATAPTWYA